VSGIFISYRREHTAYIVGRMHDRLAAHFGPAQIFRDVENLGLAADYGQRIDKVVGSCAAFLPIISDHWLLNRNPPGKRPIGIQRDWVQREVEVALRSSAMHVVPVLVEGATMPGALELPFSISSLAMRNAMTLSDLSLDADVEKLITVLEEVVAPPGAPSAAAGRPGGALSLPAAAVDAPPQTPPRSGRWFRRRSDPS